MRKFIVFRLINKMEDELLFPSKGISSVVGHEEEFTVKLLGGN